jgi:hypothetical protein
MNTILIKKIPKDLWKNIKNWKKNNCKTTPPKISRLFFS